MPQVTEILIVENETHIADVVEYTLQEHGFDTRTVYDGDLAWLAFQQRQPDLVLLDLALPGLHGLELFKHMRHQAPAVPIIMLTSRVEEVDRVLGLEMGADDYITKPFSPREMAARVKAVLRRTQAPRTSAPSERLRHGPIELDVMAFQAQYFGHDLGLTRAEFKLLSILLGQPARVFSREDLIRRIYDQGHPVTDRSVDAGIKRLRKKCQTIRPDVNPIETIYGMGYKLHHATEGLA